MSFDVYYNLHEALSNIWKSSFSRAYKLWSENENEKGDNVLFKDDGKAFLELEEMMLREINKDIDDVESIFVSIANNGELISDYFRDIRAACPQVVLKILERQKKILIDKEREMLDDASYLFNSFMEI